MSFYRSLLAAVAAIAIASPVFADDAANTMQNPSDENAAPVAQQLADNAGNASVQATDGAQQNAATDAAKINVNSASAKELMKVKGLNASKARAIVAYRKKHGEFKTLDDLANVKGFSKIKASTLKNIKEQLTL
jgi:competence protein ComEA